MFMREAFKKQACPISFLGLQQGAQFDMNFMGFLLFPQIYFGRSPYVGKRVQVDRGKQYHIGH